MSNVVEEQSIHIYTKQDKVRVIGGSDDGKLDIGGLKTCDYLHLASCENNSIIETTCEYLSHRQHINYSDWQHYTRFQLTIDLQSTR